MIRREKRLYIFYTICFLSAIISVFISGWGIDSSILPANFLFEIIAIFVGLPLFLFDLINIRPFTRQSIKVHAYGLGANGLMLFLTILSAVN